MKKFIISIIAVLFCTLSFAQDNWIEQATTSPSICKDNSGYIVTILMDYYYNDGVVDVDQYKFDETSALLIEFEDGSKYKVLPTTSGELKSDCQRISDSCNLIRWFRTSRAKVEPASDVDIAFDIAYSSKKIIKTRCISNNNNYLDFSISPKVSSKDSL